MKILYFDCFSGISGDMTLGALLNMGIDKEVFRRELDKLNLSGYDINIKTKLKNGIAGTDVDVVVYDEHNHTSELEEHCAGAHEDNHDHHEHKHHHHHNHNHHHGKNQHKHHHHGHKHGRNLVDIENLIEASGLTERVKELSKKIFREIAKAEAKVHNKPVDEVHFHEVGAVDSIVDIVGVAICIDLLNVDRIFSSPLHDGKGFIKCQHGMMPVPVPAVMEMLKDSNIPLITEDVNTELVTPTGMGIIKCLSSSFGDMPSVTIEKVGYGMGKRETGRFNALRVVMGTLCEKAGFEDEIAVLETNIDDMSPEILGYTMECLLENGALDVFYTPIYMKKSRPAVMLTVLGKKEDEEKLAGIILRETSTLGVRRSTSKRYVLGREIMKVDTGLGEVRVKVALGEGIKRFAPEYEDCREIARMSGMPIDSVYKMVQEKIKDII
ncbi:MAG: nickel pincer cofactor biosynthesis protein LarC [Clostridia bacterium]|nr:nickel pincer cofactor biosynthesis protein LarC [Clostridia bacterium]